MPLPPHVRSRVHDPFGTNNRDEKEDDAPQINGFQHDSRFAKHDIQMKLGYGRTTGTLHLLATYAPSEKGSMRDRRNQFHALDLRAAGAVRSVR